VGAMESAEKRAPYLDLEGNGRHETTGKPVEFL